MAKFLENYPLKQHNTFALDVIAEKFAAFNSIQELKSLLNENISPIRILGGGSNILLTKNVNGYLLKNQINSFDILSENESQIILEVGGGHNWHEFVMKCVEKGWQGVENLALIPGTVGAAPIQNIGAYGVEQNSVFEKLTALHLETKQIKTFSKKDCHFGYRDSIFKNRLKGVYCILSVTYSLSKNTKPEVQYQALKKLLHEKKITNPTIVQVAQAVIEVRQSKLPDPKEIGNGGSFFKNPVVPKTTLLKLRQDFSEIPFYQQNDPECMKIPAAWLIDQCGWKGFRKDGVGVHEKQALVLVHYGNASGNQVYDLSSKIKKSVFEKFGIEIEREVNIW